MNFPTPHSKSPRAFTLVEVMISISITLALIIGVNQVFKIAADTVGAGQMLSAKIRDSRAAQAVFQNDLSHMSRADGAFIIIDSRTQPAYLNKVEADSDSDGDGDPLTWDIDADGSPETISSTALNRRNHRVDLLSFFARDLFRRQTGNLLNTPGGSRDVYAANQSSNEALVKYGHLRLFDGTDNLVTDTNWQDVVNHYFDPGKGTIQSNPYNYYAGDWVLGRMAMLLTTPNFDSDSNGDLDAMKDRSAGGGALQQFWYRNPAAPSVTGSFNLFPLGSATQGRYTGQGNPNIRIGVWDVAGTSIQEFRQILSNFITVEGVDQNWWSDQSDIGPLETNAFNPNMAVNLSANVGYRFCGNTRPFRPMNARQMAGLAGVLMNNCTQFVVEYAGDFVFQTLPNSGPPEANWGDLQPLPTPGVPEGDGVIDFYYVEDQNTNQWIRKIRWYGFPRDTDRPVIAPGERGGPDGMIEGWNTDNARGNNEMPDVIPLRDVLRKVPNTPAPASYRGAPWEKISRPFAVGAAGNDDLLPPANDYAVFGAVNFPNRYTCAWGPNDTLRPKMIRVLFTLDDPTGRLGDGQTFEYVFTLP